MPTYEYRCTECGRKTEAYQSFTDPPLEKCETCSGKLRRLFSPVGVLFKGSGFYSTDARSSASKSEKQGANGEGKPDQAKSEAAPKGGEAKKSSESAPAAPKGKPSEKSS